MKKRITMTEEQRRRRFWSRVDRSGGPNACWPWLGGKHERGYGQMNWNGKTVRCSRKVWEITHGPIPRGLHVLHKCDNPPCCNPRHLFLGTVKVNAEDRTQKHRGYIGYGEANPATKWSDAEIAELRRRYAAGETRKQLAAAYKMSIPNVRKIVLGLARK